MKWDHIGIKSSDIQRSLHFYCEILGFKRQEEVEILGKTYYFVGNGSTSIEIEAGGPDDRQADPRSQTGLYHLAFTVEDVRGLVERLKAEAVPVVLEPISTRPGRLVAFIEDPDGVMIQLIQLLGDGHAE